MDTTARPAHTTYHTLQAQQLLGELEKLAFAYGAGQLTPAQVIQRAESYERQAQDISWAAYAAGRGYAATTRVTGEVFAGAMDLAFTARAAVA